MATPLNKQSFTYLKTKNKNLKNKSSFSFVFFGDTRSNSSKNPINTTILREILNEINKGSPTFVLHGGDIAYRGTSKNLTNFVNIINNHPLTKNKKTPFFVIPGNHEVYQTNREDNQWNLKNYHRIIGDDRFIININSFDFRVIAENNVTDLKPFNLTDAHYGFKDSTIKFIEKTIQNNKGTSLIAMHAPPMLSCWRHSMGPTQTKTFLNEVTRKHPNKTPIVLVSHIHAYGSAKDGKTTFFLSGGGGAPLIKSDCTSGVYNFIVFKVTKNSITPTIHWKAKNGKWTSAPLKSIPRTASNSSMFPFIGEFMDNYGFDELL